MFTSMRPGLHRSSSVCPMTRVSPKTAGFRRQVFLMQSSAHGRSCRSRSTDTDTCRPFTARQGIAMRCPERVGDLAQPLFASAGLVSRGQSQPGRKGATTSKLVTRPDRCRRPPSARSVADEALCKRIAKIHEASKETYGPPAFTLNWLMKVSVSVVSASSG